MTNTLLGPGKRACLVTVALALVAAEIPSCTAENPVQPVGNGSSSPFGDSGGGSGQYVVAMIQSPKAQAEDLTQSDIADLVTNAVALAGGLDFIRDGQTVVLKPNLVTAYTDKSSAAVASQTVNGIATDWRVVKALADLVRAKDPTGQILIMEGSTIPTATVYSLLGYTTANFGASVDQFIALEGTSCADRATTALVERTVNGKTFWANRQYVSADVVISIPVMKTHSGAGITGAVKNLGIGTTPVGQYSAQSSAGSTDCTRGKTSATIDHTTPETLGQFIHDYYRIRPPDFVVMDALQGLAHGPNPAWDDSGTYDYESSKMNMRLILAGKNAVAVDTVESLVMKCDPNKVPHLTKLAADGLGTTDIENITVFGGRISDVAKPFACKQTAICPGR